MTLNYGFCDLCVNVDIKDTNELRKTLKKLHTFGYKTVALNRSIDESIFQNDKGGNKKKRKEKSEVPKNPDCQPDDIKEIRQEFEGKLDILQRLTYDFSDASKLHTFLPNTVTRKFDLFAVRPKNQAAFQFACGQLNVDIIALDPTNLAKINRKCYNQAVERGVHFEINYSHIINRRTRVAAIHGAHLFFIFGKSKNVIVSSGAETDVFLRSPYDVINLGLILGLNEWKAKAAILHQCKQLILKSKSRVFGKSVSQVKIDVEESSDEMSESKSPSTKKLKTS